MVSTEYPVNSNLIKIIIIIIIIIITKQKLSHLTSALFLITKLSKFALKNTLFELKDLHSFVMEQLLLNDLCSVVGLLDFSQICHFLPSFAVDWSLLAHCATPVDVCPLTTPARANDSSCWFLSWSNTTSKRHNASPTDRFVNSKSAISQSPVIYQVIAIKHRIMLSQ